MLVSALTAIGLVGVAPGTPKVAHEPDPGVRASLFAFGERTVPLGLSTTVLSFTGPITAFTYVVPALREVSGFAPGWVTGVLLVHGLGTLVGSTPADRVPPHNIARVLPVPLAVLGVALLAQGFVLESEVAAVVSVFALGASAFTAGPLTPTYLMGQAGPASGLVASVNISAFNVAVALGPVLGGAVLSSGLGLRWVGTAGGVATALGLGVALLVRRATARPATPVPALLAAHV